MRAGGAVSGAPAMEGTCVVAEDGPAAVFATPPTIAPEYVCEAEPLVFAAPEVGESELADPLEYGAERVRLSVPNQNSVVSLAGRGCKRMIRGVIDRTISLFSRSE